MALYDLTSTLDQARFKKRCNQLYRLGRIVELSEVKRKRTIDQNAIMHMWFAVVASDLGCSPDDAKRDIKRVYGGMEEYHSPITGRIEVREWRTSAMTKEQMSDFLTWLKVWADSELGIYLPSEDDAGFGEMLDRYGRR